MEFIFYKNQLVDIIYENSSIKVVAKQNVNTPGVYIEHNLKKGIMYNINLSCYKRSRKTVRLWFANKTGKQVYYDSTEVNKNGTIINKIIKADNDFLLKFGILFVNPKKNDYYMIKKLEISEIYNTTDPIIRIKNDMIPSIQIPNYKLDYYKNQSVNINNNGNIVKIISKQTTSTPGGYVTFNISPSKEYLLDMCYTKSSARKLVKLWVTYGNTTIYTKNDIYKKMIKLKRIINSEINTTIKIGLLFVKPKMNDYIVVNKLNFQEFDKINNNKIEIINIYRSDNEKKLVKSLILSKNIINKGYKIIQLLFPFQKQRIYFLRTLLIPQLSNNNILYLIPSICKDFILNNLIYKKMIGNMIFINGWSDILNILNKINPEKIILTIAPHKVIINKLEKYLNKIYYVHHGVILDKRVTKIIKKRWDNRIKYIVPNKVGNNILVNSNINKKNIKLINGLPQFDYILHNSINLNKLRKTFMKKYNVSTNKKIILLINASANVEYYNNPNFLKEIINMLNKLRIEKQQQFDNYLILKNKYETKYDIENSSTICLTKDDVIYDYFFADVIIVVEGGTSLVESFLGVCAKTIFIDWYKRDNDMFKTEKLNLLKARNINELEKYIKRKIGDNNENIEYLKKEANNYINTILGYNNIKLVSDKILEIIYRY